MSGRGRTNFFLLTVDMLTTLGVTFFDTAVKARCADSMSAGTSFTGGSASATCRFDLNIPGSPLSEGAQAANKKSEEMSNARMDNGRIILTTLKDSL